MPLWQPMHFASKIGCSALSHGTPTILSYYVHRLERRSARGLSKLTGVDASARIWPGWMTVVLARSSWQPPHMRASALRPEIHTGSLRSDRSYLSTTWRRIGMLAGTSAAHELSDSTGTSPMRAAPSSSVRPNISGKPSSTENPSMMRTLTIDPGSKWLRLESYTSSEPISSDSPEKPFGGDGSICAGARRGLS